MQYETVMVKIFGLFACYSRPEMKVERMSYEVPTPSACRGALEAIFFRPQFRWIIESIVVHNRIRFIEFRRNEIQHVIRPKTVQKWMKAPAAYEPQYAGGGSTNAKGRQMSTMRNTVALCDVSYTITARPHVYEPNAKDHPTKYTSMFNKRVAKGKCFHRPYLGCREFACDFKPADPNDVPLDLSRDLGMMLYDINFSGNGKNNKPVFFHAHLNNGVIDTRPEIVVPDKALREEVLACSSKP
jgi:CRISPR-associated protein Cas5d